MKTKFKFRSIASVGCVLFFLLLAVATGSDDKDSKIPTKTEKKSTKPVSEPEMEKETEEPQSEESQSEEPINIHNSSEGENASDDDEEVLIITNASDDEEL